MAYLTTGINGDASIGVCTTVQHPEYAVAIYVGSAHHTLYFSVEEARKIATAILAQTEALTEVAA